VADVPPDLAEARAAAEQERAAAARVRKAQDRMVEMIAAEQGLEQSAKEELYAAIEAWRANPTARQLDALNHTLADKGVTGPVRTRVRFVATYLGNLGARRSAAGVQPGRPAVGWADHLAAGAADRGDGRAHPRGRAGGAGAGQRDPLQPSGMPLACSVTVRPTSNANRSASSGGRGASMSTSPPLPEFPA
jgi:hypothetical protein